MLPARYSQMGSASGLPPHVEAIIAQAAKLSQPSQPPQQQQSHEASEHGLLAASSAPPSNIVDLSLSDDLMDDASEAGSHAGAPLSPTQPEAQLDSGSALPMERGDSSDEESLNEVDDAPKPTIISLDSDNDEEAPQQHTHKQQQQQTQQQQATTTTKQTAKQQAAAAAAAKAVDGGVGCSGSEDEADDQQYCYCRQTWSGDEIMVSCDQCLSWFHAGQPSQRSCMASEHRTLFCLLSLP